MLSTHVILAQLFTKAYEYFKAHRAKNMTYMVAHQIALAHLEAGKPDLALKSVFLSASVCRRISALQHVC